MNSNITLNKRKTLLATFVAMFAAGATTQGAMAQTESATIQSQIDEIIVTATKRAESIQDVPIAISAFGEKEIKTMGAQSIQSLMGSIPNVQFPNSGNDLRNDISIRGTFSNLTSFGLNSGVGVYLDGVYIGKSQAFNVDAADLERVEVLRGPQGTLFGKNTIAGVVNVITKKPSDEFTAHVEGQMGDDDLRRIRAGINIPLIEGKLSTRLSINDVSRDGPAKNLFNGDDIGNLDSTSGRFQLLFTPNDQTSARLSVDAMESESRNYLLEPISGGTASSTPFTSNQDVNLLIEKTEKGVSLTVDHEFSSGYSLTSVTGWRDDESTALTDEDLTILDQLSGIVNFEQEQFSQELRIASPKGDLFDFVVGLYYFDQSVLLRENLAVGADWFGIPGQASDKHEIDVTSHAVFGSSNFHLSDSLTWFVGARYTSEDQENLTTIQGDPIIVSIFNIQTSNKDKTTLDAAEVSWSTGLRYTATEDVMVYGSVSRGFKAGGFNTTLRFVGDSPDNFSVDPEFVTSYEIGTKTSWADNQIRLNLAAFYLSYTDFQVLTIDTAVNPPQNKFLNAGEVESSGFEIELSAVPTTNLSVSAGLGYVDPKFKKFNNASDPDLGLIDGAGNRTTLSSRWTANTAIDYRLPVSNLGTWVSHLDYNYRSNYYALTAVHNNPKYLMSGYGLFNARIGFESINAQWSVYAWGQNLTNKRVLEDFLQDTLFGGDDRGRYTAPRRYGVTLKYQF